ncbi:MAG: metal-dependent hydrolase [Spirochaetota bacterium]|nr:metal-dependent hydrolase [Spirochaetota bacterium]
MQAGHIAVALAISSYSPELTGGEIDAFSFESIALVMVAHWLPNFDVIPIWLKIAKPSFHCTWSHSLLFILIVGLLLVPFNISWAILAIISLIFHYISDLPSTVGLPLLLPLNDRRFSIRLWADSGYFGWETMKGSYIQAWPWILEGGAFLFLFIRAYQEAVWPFV